jgi:hypothetical protein
LEDLSETGTAEFPVPIDVAALLRRAITARPEQQRRLLNAHVAKALDP